MKRCQWAGCNARADVALNTRESFFGQVEALCLPHATRRAEIATQVNRGTGRRGLVESVTWLRPIQACPASQTTGDLAAGGAWHVRTCCMCHQDVITVQGHLTTHEAPNGLHWHAALFHGEALYPETLCLLSVGDGYTSEEEARASVIWSAGSVMIEVRACSDTLCSVNYAEESALVII